MLTAAQAWDILGRVPDPEIPAISVTELGIVRDVQAAEDGVDVVVTPTYSGCPATEAIAQSIREALAAAGAIEVRVRQQLSPAWSTDWIAEDARERLRAYGIAPPGECDRGAERPLSFVPRVACPRCDSADTERLSQFGSTACKALYRCRACREPFEYFKPL
ncbi:MAG: 1,2-phenylacetyl-CoA epoxidase subunit PaaD [Burkholderiaceae bacterium]